MDGCFVSDPLEVPAVQGLLLGHGDHRRNKVSSLFHRIRIVSPVVSLSGNGWSCHVLKLFLSPAQKKTPIFGVTMT